MFCKMCFKLPLGQDSTSKEVSNDILVKKKRLRIIYHMADNGTLRFHDVPSGGQTHPLAL